MRLAISRTLVLWRAVGHPLGHHDRLLVVVDHALHELDVGLGVAVLALGVGVATTSRDGSPGAPG